MKFCARLSRSWSATKRLLRAGLADQIHEMGTSDAPVPLRILRHALPNGMVLVLITNVLDITAEDFAAL